MDVLLYRCEQKREQRNLLRVLQLLRHPKLFDQQHPWTPPASASGVSYYQIPSFGYNDNGFTSVSTDDSRTEDVNITAKITLTWVPDTSLPSDPAPPSLWLIESSNAQAVAQYQDGTPGTNYGNATADDGIGDAPVTTTANGVTSGVYSRSSTSSVPPPPPPPHWFQQPISGGTASFTRTFSAHADATLPHDLSQGAMDLSCVAGGYSVAIHAQPYNFRLGDYSDPNSGDHPNGVGKNSNGDLHFHYIWSSTDGNIASLTTSKIYEHVSAAGNTPASFSTQNGIPVYSPPNPPFNYTVPQVYDQPDPNQSGFTPGTQGYQDDLQLRGSYIVPTFVDQFGVNNYTSASYHTTQDWQFDDSATGQTHVELLGPITITRSVTGSSNPWVYNINRSGFSNTFSLP